MTTASTDPIQVLSLPAEPAQPAQDERGIFIEVCLQISHRFAIVAFLSLVVVWFLMFKVSPAYQWPLVAACATADLAILFAAVASLCSADRPKSRKEARGLLIFNGIIFGITIYTMLFTRMSWFRIAMNPLTSAPPPLELPR